MNKEKLMWYGVAAVGGYFAVTKGIPWLVKQLGIAAGKTGSEATGAVAKAAGATAGGILTAAPKAAGAIWQETRDWAISDENVFKPVGGSIGSWLYDITHPTKAPTLVRIKTVNGKKIAMYSDGTSRPV